MASYENNTPVKSSLPVQVPWDGQSVDNVRRTFGIGDTVHQLAPEQSLFFTYLSKLSKRPTDETVWKPIEYRPQWQRRNFKVKGSVLTGGNDAALTDGADVDNSGTLTHILLWTDYNYQGKVVESAVDPIDNATYVGYAPVFLAKGQVLRLNGEVWKLTGDFHYHKYTDADNTTVSTKAKAGTEIGYIQIPIASLTNVSTGSAMAANDDTFDTDGTNYHGQVIGSQWAEATGAPEGWRDDVSTVEFFTQIFKTAVPLMSGSSMATRYRGFANEWKRIYSEHLKSHKMDLEQAFLFGHGKYTNQDVRYSWGALPFIENYGKTYNLTYGATKDATDDFAFNYGGLVELMDDFMNWESGNSGQKFCITSRKVINYLNGLADSDFIGASVGSSNNIGFRANLDVKTSRFAPVNVTKVGTSWGDMNFIAHPLMRHDMEDKILCMDLKNVSLRPLKGNGISRDTFVETNIQENDIDGRKDQIITEAGLEILLPETHAVITCGDFVS